MATASTPRVKRFRRKMTECGYARFEVSIDQECIDKLRNYSATRQMPIWEAVEAAINLLVRDSGNTTG